MSSSARLHLYGDDLLGGMEEDNKLMQLVCPGAFDYRKEEQ